MNLYSLIITQMVLSEDYEKMHSVSLAFSFGLAKTA
jgi:hypothetical protein